MSKFFGAGTVDGSGRPLPADDLDLGQLWRAVVAKRRWIVIPTLLTCLGTAIAVNVIPPRYMAETRIILQNGDNFYTRPGSAPETERQIDDEAVQSQVQVIMSRDLARDTIRKLDLTHNPLFNPPTEGPVKRLLSAVGLRSRADQASPEDKVLEVYYDRLQVFQVGKSRVVAIEFTSEDPDLAARVANTVAELYITLQQGVKQDAARSASDWLASNIDSLRKRVAEAEAKVEDFRARSGLLRGSSNTTLPTQQLADISSQLAAQRAAQSDAQAKAKMIRDMLSSGNLLEIPDVANNDLVRRLTEQRIALRTQLALESRNLLPEHPRIKELTAQLSDLDNQIRLAAERVARSFETDAKLSGSRVESLTAAINAQKQVTASANEDEVKLRALELDARSERDQLESYLAKYREAQARDSRDASPADARIVSRAVAPAIPSFPKKIPTILIATLAVFALTSAAIVSGELLSGRATGGGEGAGADQAPVPPAMQATAISQPYLTLPAPIDVEFKDVGPAPPPPDRKDGTAMDVILAKLAVPAREGRGRRLLVAEAAADDTSTDVARGLARHLARNARVVLVSLAPPAGTDEEPGLTDLLAERAGFADVITREAGSRLHVVGHGTQPSDVLINDAEGVVSALTALDQTYDWVVCELPANTTPALMRIFADRTDGSVLVAREGQTEEKTVAGYQNLQTLGARNIVVALTGVGGDDTVHQAA
jgi:uncharacterized protein involved in exopolysaccharide biosynthesis/Mrp family chromosome partitioning ATPase